MQAQQMEKPKRKRKAVWRECKWCKLRGAEVIFSSGKLKCLERHMVQCKIDYELEQKTIKDSHDLWNLVNCLKEQVVNLTSRVAVLELKKDRYYIERNMFWKKITPRITWKRAEQNVIRLVRACLSVYKPSKYNQCPFDYLEMYVLPKEPSLHDILSLMLWPILETRDDKTVLRGDCSADEYHIFKRIWGKQDLPNLSSYVSALEKLIELGLDPSFLDCNHIWKMESEFQRLMRRFQQTKTRVGKRTAPQGIISLKRVWENVYPIPTMFLDPCKSLGPEEILSVESSILRDPPSSE